MSNIDRNIIAYAFLARAKRKTDDFLSGLMPTFKPTEVVPRFPVMNGAELGQLRIASALTHSPAAWGSHDQLIAAFNFDLIYVGQVVAAAIGTFQPGFTRLPIWLHPNRSLLRLF